jgi:hypothetical protein
MDAPDHRAVPVPDPPFGSVEYYTSLAEDRRRQQEVWAAFRAIGKDAVPFLLRWIQHQQAPWRVRLENWRYFPVKLRTVAEQERAWPAVWAFQWVGSQADQAIPGLVRLATGTNADISTKAWCALGAIGADSIPTLIRILTNRPPLTSQREAGLILAWSALGANAGAGVPELVKLLKEQHEGVSYLAAILLGVGHVDAELAVPALVSAVSSSNRLVRGCAVYALGEFGDRGRAAVPVLVQALRDSEGYVRSAATNALWKIAPEVLDGKGHGGNGRVWRISESVSCGATGYDAVELGLEGGGGLGIVGDAPDGQFE